MKLDHIPMTVIRTRCLELNPDTHWFDEGTMRFFNTELPQYGYDTVAGVFFVTAETDPRRNRMYTIRKLETNGHISTVGKFHYHASKADASQRIRDIVRDFRNQNAEATQ